MNEKKNGKYFRKRNRNKILFCVGVLIIPLGHYLIFYWGVNFNSIKLAFSEYKGFNQFEVYSVDKLFTNFSNILDKIARQKQWQTYFLNSYKVWALSFVLYTPMGWITAYFIYKKGKVGSLFKVIMFFPSLLSPMVIGTIFVSFANEGLSTILGSDFPLMSIYHPTSAFWTKMIWGFFGGAGANMLIYVNAMAGISDSIVEAAELDGVGFFSEFFYITFPMVFSMWKQFFIVGICGILGDQFSLFEYYGTSAPVELQTIGYYLYRTTINDGDRAYPELSALGLIMTCITVPTVLLVRWLLNRIDPMEEKKV